MNQGYLQRLPRLDHPRMRLSQLFLERTNSETNVAMMIIRIHTRVQRLLQDPNLRPKEIREGITGTPHLVEMRVEMACEIQLLIDTPLSNVIHRVHSIRLLTLRTHSNRDSDSTRILKMLSQLGYSQMR